MSGIFAGRGGARFGNGRFAAITFVLVCCAFIRRAGMENKVDTSCIKCHQDAGTGVGVGFGY